MACKDAIVFFVFFRPPDKHKNPDWSDFINYLIHPSDWLATCHSKAFKVFSHFTYSTRWINQEIVPLISDFYNLITEEEHY